MRQAMLRSAAVELARLDVLEAELKLEEARTGLLAGAPRSELLEAEAGIEAARERFVDALLDVAMEVEEAYYNLLRAAELAAIARRGDEQADRRLAIATTRLAAGWIARHEYDEARLRRAEAAHELLAAQERYETALESFLLLTGSSDAAFPPTAPPAPTPSVELDQALAEAEAARREIRQAVREVEAARRNLEFLQTSDAAPVAITRAEIALRRAEIQLEQAKALVRADVREAYAALQRARADALLKESERVLAGQRLAVAQARYEAGLISLLDLMAAETAAMQADLAAAGALWDHRLEATRFLRAIGRAHAPSFPREIEEFMAGWHR